jgi:hypothetical protein
MNESELLTGNLFIDINFHTKNHASVLLQSSFMDDERQVTAELLSFCFITVRQISNLAGSRIIQNELLKVAEDIDDFLDKLETKNETLYVTDFQNIKVEKKFLSKAYLDTSLFNYTLNSKGFGFFCRDFEMYAASCVYAVLYFLCKQRIENFEHLKQFVKAASLFGRADFSRIQYQTQKKQMDIGFELAKVASL